MTVDDYASKILTLLGSPTVVVEIENDIPSIVSLAFEEIKPAIATTKLITVPISGDYVDLQEYNISTIVSVFRTNYPGLPAMDEYINYNLFLGSGFFSIDDYSAYMTTQQLKNTIAQDLSFRWENPRLYVYLSYPKSPTISVEYIPNYSTVDEITDPYWQKWILRLATALSKLVLGRVRSKYELDTSLYSLDGATLIAEAQAEIDSIRTYIDENSDIVLPID